MAGKQKKKPITKALTKNSNGRFSTQELEELSLQLIEEYTLVFMTEVVSLMPCSAATLYNHGLDKLDTVKMALEKNKVATKVYLRGKMRDSDSPAMTAMLYKLLGTPEELDRLGGGAQRIEMGGANGGPIQLTGAVLVIPAAAKLKTIEEEQAEEIWPADTPLDEIV